ncbi:MBL fold metallo-hydrolase [Aureimonas sp. OT7]|uniref:MBL fold metallo-hydrolase n=1 Tax=Aureimonas TaxID=414371 RepID=UPI00177FD6F7|nr:MULTISPECIES: MBL fold metallo-hydrolase [Aureimonas]QOG07974.1 MBL fold metallo-hydrolase [Aureimonas sp. OT7]
MNRHKMGLDRRGALKLALGTAAAGAMVTAARAQQPAAEPAAPAAAPAPQSGGEAALAPGWQRFKLGDARITVVLDGVRPGDGPHPTFGEDQTAEAVAELMEANLLPAGRFVTFFNPVVIETGGETVLIDTGFGSGGRDGGLGQLRQRMEAAGIPADRVTMVVMTHLHGDHIGGLMEGDAPAFPRAHLIVGRQEYEFWTSDAAKSGGTAGNAEAVAAKVSPLESSMTLAEDGDEVAPGLFARAAYGHTPGHFVYELTSGGKRLFLMGDTFSQSVVTLQKPEWHVRFDMDKAAAAATRQRFAAMLADEKLPFTGYHLPFPAVGYVQRDGEAFRYVPETYALMIEDAAPARDD